VLPADLSGRLESKKEEDPAARQALVLMLGQFNSSQLPQHVRTKIGEILLDIYQNDPHGGVHSAAEWVLAKWGREDDLRLVQQRLSERDRADPNWSTEPERWYLGKNGHTLVVVDANKTFTMGLEQPGPGQLPGPIQPPAPRHQHTIPRAVAVATRETTIAQFRALVPDFEFDQQQLKQTRLPMTSIEWSWMAKYCNALGKLEDIPADQWCYREDSSAGVLEKGDFLTLPGYRLPTEAEWECFCRAGSMTKWYFGNDVELTPNYAWYRNNTPSMPTLSPQPVGLLKPNRLGMFDMSGNVWEACHHTFRWPADRTPNPPVEDVTGAISSEPDTSRGGAFDNAPPSLRSGWRNPYLRHASKYTGFRVARTLKE
jgi:formylglycine-generating enzyme required for sulfatase activity